MWVLFLPLILAIYWVKIGSMLTTCQSHIIKLVQSGSPLFLSCHILEGKKMYTSRNTQTESSCSDDSGETRNKMSPEMFYWNNIIINKNCASFHSLFSLFFWLTVVKIKLPLLGPEHFLSFQDDSKPFDLLLQEKHIWDLMMALVKQLLKYHVISYTCVWNVKISTVKKLYFAIVWLHSLLLTRCSSAYPRFNVFNLFIYK